MAGREDVGGFYYALGVDIDRGSFARAGDAINGLVKTAQAAAVAIGAAIGVSFAIKHTVNEAINDINWANKLGIGTYELDKWQAVTAQIGINFNSIAGEMDELDRKFRDIKFGDWDQGTMTAIAQLTGYAGNNQGAFDALKNLSPTERFRQIMEGARDAVNAGTLTTNEARDLLKKILGGASGEMFNTLSARGIWLDTLFGSAESAVVDTSEWKDDLAEFNRQLTLTKTTFDGLWETALGLMAEKWLNPGLIKINEWLGSNKNLIKQKLEKAFTDVEDVAERTVKVIKETDWSPVTGVIKKDWDAVQKWMEDHPIDWEKVLGTSLQIFVDGLGIVLEHASTIAGHIAEIFKVLAGLGTDIFNGARGLYNRAVEGIENTIKDIGDWTESDQGQYWTNKVQGWLPWFTIGNGKDMDDGIISPGGHVTQVAPDDWVIAFKNLEDVAGAMHPAGVQGGTANVTINQTFHVGGAARELPATIKEQAYRGTRSAIGEMFQNTAKLIQLMPATR